MCTEPTSPSRKAVLDFARQYSWLLLAVLAVYSLYGAYHYYVFEYLHPGSFLSMSGKNPHSLLPVLLQTGYLIVGGVVAAFVLPLGYASLPFVSWASILVILAIVSSIIACRAFSGLSGWHAKRHSIAAVSMILLTSLIVSLGRPMTGITYFWYAKYTGIPYFWFCVLISFLWDHFRRRGDADSRRVMNVKTSMLLVAFIAVQISSDYFVADVLGLKVTGYVGHLRDAKERKSAVSQLRSKLVEPLARGSHEIKIPTLDGRFIAAQYPCLYEYNLSHYLDFIVPEGRKVQLCRNEAMQKWAAKDVVTVQSLRSTVDGIFLDRLADDPYLQQLYLAPVELRTKAVPVPAADRASSSSAVNPGGTSTLAGTGGPVLDSDGTAEIMVERGAWDPEKKSKLLLDFAYAARRPVKDGPGPVEIKVVFDGELKIPYHGYPVVVQADRGVGRVCIDLMQLYAFSLNPTVNSLRIRLSTPGSYRFSEARLI